MLSEAWLKSEAHASLETVIHVSRRPVPGQDGNGME
jgi:hypothetical protein